MADCYLPSVTTGTTWTRTVTWDDSSGNPINVTGYSAKLQFRSGTSLILELNSSNGGIAVGTTDGTFTLNMTSTQTGGLTPGCLDYDLLVTSGTGTTTRLLVGALAVVAAVTHS